MQSGQVYISTWSGFQRLPSYHAIAPDQQWRLSRLQRFLPLLPSRTLPGAPFGLELPRATEIGLLGAFQTSEEASRGKLAIAHPHHDLARPRRRVNVAFLPARRWFMIGSTAYGAIQERK